MSKPRSRTGLEPVAFGLFLLILAVAQAFRLPPLRDAVTGAPVRDWTLAPSAWHLLTSPFSILADWLTCLGLRQLEAFGAWWLAAFALWRAWRGRPGRGVLRESSALLAWLGALALLLAWTVLFPRPAAPLRAAAAVRDEWLVVDFHSHTRYSWDGRRSFSPEADLRWHRAQGFDAAFITDHNRIEGSTEALAASERAERDGDASLARALPGEEVSLDGAHVVALGARSRVDPDAYRGPEGLRRFLREARTRFGSLPLMSLPEYWRHHRGELDELADAGAAGFEIVNSTPRGLDLPPRGREEVLALCRRRALFPAAATDNHGWARSACGWNLVRLPGWRRLADPALDAALLRALRSGGYEAVRVLERPVPRPGASASLAVDPFRWLWAAARTLSPLQAVVCALWALAACLAARRASP